MWTLRKGKMIITILILILIKYPRQQQQQQQHRMTSSWLMQKDNTRRGHKGAQKVWTQKSEDNFHCYSPWQSCSCSRHNVKRKWRGDWRRRSVVVTAEEAEAKEETIIGDDDHHRRRCRAAVATLLMAIIVCVVKMGKKEEEEGDSTQQKWWLNNSRVPAEDGFIGGFKFSFIQSVEKERVAVNIITENCRLWERCCWTKNQKGSWSRKELVNR